MAALEVDARWRWPPWRSTRGGGRRAVEVAVVEVAAGKAAAVEPEAEAAGVRLEKIRKGRVRVRSAGKCHLYIRWVLNF